MRASACAVYSEYDDPSSPIVSQWGRYDADSRLVELRSFDKNGTLLSMETRRWENGREVLHRIQDASGAWQMEWFYDEDGRLLRRTYTPSNLTGQPPEYTYHYDASGRLITMVHPNDHVTTYLYDAAGRLQSIDSGDVCDRHEALCERYTYHPNGQPKEIHRWNDFFWDMYEYYDSLGRLSSRSWGDYDIMGDDTYAYDAAGRLVRHWVKDGKLNFDREAITTSAYDAQGLLRLRRYAEDNVLHPLHDDSPDIFGHVRITQRASYICGTKILALDEWDSNEDGRVDARLTHERDATGRLVRERYSGTPRLHKGPVRRDFFYTCD